MNFYKSETVELKEMTDSESFENNRSLISPSLTFEEILMQEGYTMEEIIKLSESVDIEY